VRADEQPRADLGVGEAVAGETGDLGLLRGELLAGLDAAFADALAGCQQLALGTLGERLGAHGIEHLERGAQLLAGVQATPLIPQPLAVDEMGAGEVHPQARASEPLDRLSIQALGRVALAEQRAAARLGPEAPFGSAGAGRLGGPLERAARALRLPGPDRRLDQIGQRPQRRSLLV